MKILIAEDDQVISNTLRQQLESSDFSVAETHDGEQAFALANSQKFDLFIIDVMLPKIDGLSLVTKLRNEHITTPVLILSAKRSVDDRVQGLTAGADDYLTKPFAYAEVLARIQALLRRRSWSPNETKLSAEGVIFDLITREVTRDGRKIDLQQKELALLEYLMRNPGTVLTKAQILKQVWSYDFDPQTNVVDVLVYRLRAKIDKDAKVKLIHTVRGIGYVFRAN